MWSYSFVNIINKTNDVLRYKWKSTYKKILISNFFTNKNLKKAIVEQMKQKQKLQKRSKATTFASFFCHETVTTSSKQGRISFKSDWKKGLLFSHLLLLSLAIAFQVRNELSISTWTLCPSRNFSIPGYLKLCRSEFK